MADAVRLSEVSARVTAALAVLDEETLQALTERLKLVVDGRLNMVPEPGGTVRRELRILEGVLAATEQNISVLERLHGRKARQAWAL